MTKYYEIFRRNFPYIVRDENEALKIINNPENKFFDYCDDDGNLVGTSIVHKNTILMLCVDSDYRNRGIGSSLLNRSEDYISNSGYDKVNIGVGDNYLMPGIPMATKPYDEVLKEDKIYTNVNNDSYEFFRRRGYEHAWADANCFDMRADLDNVEFPDASIGDTVNGINYRFARKEDIPKIIECTDDAEKSFSEFYKEEKYYDEESKQRVLIATKDNDVCGTLMICMETEGKGLGSVGCTAVSHKYRGQHIGVNMVVLGTKYLKSIGLKNGYLGYTYSGLDKMYGYAGYKICIYYAMAQKSLVLDNMKTM